MQIKTISYQRVINLGNYESKRLELFGEILEGEGEDEAISRLMETVERKVREDAHRQIEEEIGQLKKQLRELKAELSTLQQKPEDDGF